MESGDQQFGALPLIYGTLVSSLVAIVLAGVVGILAATYLAEFAPRWLARPLGIRHRAARGGP